MPPTISNISDFIGLDQFEYHHTVPQTQGIALVLFRKQGCGACAHWEHLLRKYREFHPAITLYQVDVGSEPALVHELELFHLPAIFLYVDGQFHAEIQTEARLSRLEQAIQQALAAPPQEAP